MDVEQQVASNTDELRPGECILSNVGVVNWKASFQDKSIDGAFANFIYDGGAGVSDPSSQRRMKRRSSLRCDGVLDPVGFKLTIGEWRNI